MSLGGRMNMAKLETLGFSVALMMAAILVLSSVAPLASVQFGNAPVSGRTLVRA